MFKMLSLILILQLQAMAQFQGQRSTEPTRPIAIQSSNIVLSQKMDEKFGGYFVDVDATRSRSRNLSIQTVLTIQKNLRDCLEVSSKSYFRIKQRPYIESCLEKSTNASEVPLTQTSKLTVVFDMDETLLTQWHRISLENPGRTTLILRNRDHVLEESNGAVIYSPLGVTIRPGANQILRDLSQNPAIQRIIFFTARDGKSAKELTDYFLQVNPILMKKFGGLYSRNHLRFDGQISVPSKDLRMFEPSLRNIILIDDNSSRVLQKRLSFSIPKFNADLYLQAKTANDQEAIMANNIVLPFVHSLITKVMVAGTGSFFYPYSAEVAETKKINWGKEILVQSDFESTAIDNLLQKKIFEQEFVSAFKVTL